MSLLSLSLFYIILVTAPIYGHVHNFNQDRHGNAGNGYRPEGNAHNPGDLRSRSGERSDEETGSWRARQAASQLESLCPNVTQCSCYNSGDDVVAACFDSELEYVPAELPSNLTMLELSWTSIVYLPANNFSIFPDLRELVMYGNSIYSIASGVFSNLNNLELLKLFANNLTSLPADLFSPCPSLREIDISENQVEAIPTLNLPALTKFDASLNSLTSLTSSLFENTPELTELHLDTNKLKTLPTGLFSELGKLLKLYLNNNEIETLPVGLFTGLNSVDFIDLSANSISSLAAKQFSGPGSSLTQISLSQNSIHTIDASAFEDLPELDALLLDHNELVDVPDALTVLPLLDILSLSANPLMTIKSQAFKGIVELNEVFLSNMPSLLDLHIDAFDGNQQLQLLELTNNPNLTEFLPDHLPDDDHPLLRIISLFGNGFTYIDDDLFMGKPTLERVDLQDNPFHCDCQLQWISQVVLDGVPWARHWSQSASAPRCDSPEHIHSFSISSMLPNDLSCDDVVVSSVTDNPLVVHLHSSVNIQVMLENGLPASRWRTPDGTEYKPLRWPPMVQTSTGTDMIYPELQVPDHRQQSQRPTVTEHYTSDHNVIATFEYANATADVAGIHTVYGENGNGERSMEISLEVLPYELTLPPPTINGACGGMLKGGGIYVVSLVVSLFIALSALFRD